MKLVNAIAVIAALLSAPVALSMNGKDFVRAQLKGQKNINYVYGTDDIVFVGEGEAEFIFTSDRSQPSILVTGSVSHCVTLILYNSDVACPFAFMAHMNEHNSWESLLDMMQNAKREFAKLYNSQMNFHNLKAIALSGAVAPIPSDPKLNRDIYLVLQKDLGIPFENIDTTFFQDGVTSFHDILFDAVTHKLDVNHFDIYLRDEEISELTEGSLEIPIMSAVGPIMQTMQKKMRPTFAEWMGLSGANSSSFKAPLARAQKPACYKCATREGTIQRCEKCKVIKYCSATCQKNDWPRHRDECKKLSTP